MPEPLIGLSTKGNLRLEILRILAPTSENYHSGILQSTEEIMQYVLSGLPVSHRKEQI